MYSTVIRSVHVLINRLLQGDPGSTLVEDISQSNSVCPKNKNFFFIIFCINVTREIIIESKKIKKNCVFYKFLKEKYLNYFQEIELI